MTTAPRSEWVGRAKCAGQAPQWDINFVGETASNRITALGWAQELDLCAGCPVLRECALDAANAPHVLLQGTVTAGLPLVRLHSNRSRSGHMMKAALHQVANGAAPSAVIDQLIDTQRGMSNA